jgi:hypothetical protein
VRRLLAAPVFVALLLSGCAGREAGAAAVVGDRRITVGEVQSAYQEVTPLVGADAQFTQSVTLNWLILEPYLVAEAAGEGKGVSSQDAKVEFTKVEGAPRNPSAAAVAVVRGILARGVIVNGKDDAQLSVMMAKLAADLKADGVSINPRYGSGLDPTTSAILSTTPDWLVTPKATAPAPTP